MKKKLSKTKKILRVILIICILPIIATIVMYVFRNPLLQGTLEKIATSVNGAEVNVRGIDFEPWQMSLSWEKLEVTDLDKPAQNKFELGRTELLLEGKLIDGIKKFMAGKFIVDSAQINDFAMHTPRISPGFIVPSATESKLSKKIKKKLAAYAKEKLQKEIAQIPVFNADKLQSEVNVDSLFTMLDLVTPAKIDSLKKLYKARHAYWDSVYKNSTYKADIKYVQGEIKKIKKKKLKLKDADETLKWIENVFSKAQNLVENFQRDKDELSKDIKTLKHLKKNIPIWVKHDKERANNLAELPDGAVEKIAPMLFGNRLGGIIIPAIGMLEAAKNASTMDEQVNEPAKVDKMPHLPSFWVKTIQISGRAGDGMVISGTITDLASDQNRTKKAMIVKLEAQRPDVFTAYIDGEFDYRDGKDMSKLVMRAADMELAGTKLSNTALLPKKITSGKAAIKGVLKMENDALTASINFNAKNIGFDLDSIHHKNKKVANVVKKIAGDIKSISLSCLYTSSHNESSLRMSSDIDETISASLKDMLAAEVNRAKRKIAARIDGELQPHIEKFTAQLGADGTQMNLMSELLSSEAGSIDAIGGFSVGDSKGGVLGDAVDKVLDLFNF